MSAMKKIKRKKKKTVSRTSLLQVGISVLVLVALFIVGVIISFRIGDAIDISGGTEASGESGDRDETSAQPGETKVPTGEFSAQPGQTDSQDETSENVQLNEVEETSIDLGRGLIITDIGSYTGVYMEDGTDEIVSRVMMIVLTNSSENALQYAEISVNAVEMAAQFSVSTLLPGASVVLLEQNRMAYAEADEYTAEAKNVAFFTEELSLLEDQLKVQGYQGAINVTNISGQDITGDIIIYYKNSSADMYYGGITYRARIEGGLKAGELRQIVPEHFNADASAILFITCQ
ncbi:MAG: hypothetical protein IJZ85_02585 [Lachnospiraceae bacterium]|nr:hypothetical protein [Lachnospiraceae bacterium]